ncbi:23S rRNA (pseudouridine(1915)-N(3))-methyltransferase RlmH, partial [Pseudoflavonifractor phocaeensis]
PSPAQIDAALEKEGKAILARLPKNALLTALCVEGKPLSSEALAGQLEQWAGSGSSALAFVIGGSYGLHPSVKAQAALRLSMSPMTFPHHLARVMVLEQLYRAFQISAGSRYHK